MSSGEGGGAPVAEEAFLPGTEAFKIGVRVLKQWMGVLDSYPAIWEEVDKAEKYPLPIAKDQVPNKYISACRVLAYFAGVNGKELRRTICRKLRSHLALDQQLVNDCLCIREDALLQRLRGPEQDVIARCFDVFYLNFDMGLERAYEFFCYSSINGAVGVYYSRSCAIVQSSVMGKSRMMCELAKRIPMIYIVNRTVGDAGYPVPTPSLLGEFKKIPQQYKHNSDLYVYVKCQGFFATAAQYTQTAWKMAVESGDRSGEFLDKFLSLKDNKRFWEQFFYVWDRNTTAILGEMWDRLNAISGYTVGFEEQQAPSLVLGSGPVAMEVERSPAISEEAKQTEGAAEEEDSESEKKRRRVERESSGASTLTAPVARAEGGSPSASTSTAPVARADQAKQPYWSEVEKIIRPFMRERYLGIQFKEGEMFAMKMIVCIDEARIFSTKPPNCEWDVLTQLNRAARLLQRGGLFVFMDTLSDINVLYPKTLAPSDRAISAGQKQLVYTDILNWDLGYKAQGGSHARFIEDTVTEEHMALYGRPMWRAMQVKGEQDDSWQSLVLSKLTGEHNGGVSLKPMPQTVLTIMGSLVHFNITAGMKMVVDLIGSHMAHVDHYDSSTSQVVLSYPSDPLVSMMAAEYLSRFDGWLQFVGMLGSMLESRMITGGERGELVSMVLAMRAVDLARRSADQTPCFQSCTSVRSFLKALLVDERLLDETLEEQKPKEIMDALMNFNHFIRCETYTPNRADLLEILKQRQAVLCKRGQWGIDIIIPVILPKKYPSSAVERTFVAIKTKKSRERKKTQQKNGKSNNSKKNEGEDPEGPEDPENPKDPENPEEPENPEDSEDEEGLEGLVSRYHMSGSLNEKSGVTVQSYHDECANIRAMLLLELGTQEERTGTGSGAGSREMEMEVEVVTSGAAEAKAKAKESAYELTLENVSYIIIQCKCNMTEAPTNKYVWKGDEFKHFSPIGAGIEKNVAELRPYGAFVFAFDSGGVKSVGKISRNGRHVRSGSLECVFRNLHIDFHRMESSFDDLLNSTPNPLKLSARGADRFAKVCSASNAYGQRRPVPNTVKDWYRNNVRIKKRSVAGVSGAGASVVGASVAGVSVAGASVAGASGAGVSGAGASVAEEAGKELDIEEEEQE